MIGGELSLVCDQVAIVSTRMYYGCGECVCVCVCVCVCARARMHVHVCSGTITIPIGIKNWSWVSCEQWKIPSFREVNDLPSVTQQNRCGSWSRAYGVLWLRSLPDLWIAQDVCSQRHTSEYRWMCVRVCVCVCMHICICAIVKSPPSHRQEGRGLGPPCSRGQLSEAPLWACTQCSQVMAPDGWAARSNGE